MCSGCSGDYAGDFEDSGESPGVSERGDDAGWKLEADGPRLDAAQPGRFEVDADSEGNSRRARFLPGCPNSSAGDICDILVSATRIVEIRVITAKHGAVHGVVCAEDSDTPEAAKLSRGPVPNIIGRPSAGRKDKVDRAQVWCFRRLTAAAADEFDRWMRWARRAFGAERADSDELRRIGEGRWKRKNWMRRRSLCSR